jgi:hypothetical protein
MSGKQLGKGKWSEMLSAAKESFCVAAQAEWSTKGTVPYKLGIQGGQEN